jgi:hypothetical protein
LRNKRVKDLRYPADMISLGTCKHMKPRNIGIGWKCLGVHGFSGVKSNSTFFNCMSVLITKRIIFVFIIGFIFGVWLKKLCICNVGT